MPILTGFGRAGNPGTGDPSTRPGARFNPYQYSSGGSAPRIPAFPSPGQGAPSTPFSFPAPPMTSNVQTPPFTSTAERDPYLQQMYQDWGTYRGQLAAGSDIDAINTLQRQRDLTSGMLSELGQNAAMRGLGPESGASQYLQARGAGQAQRNMAGLQAQLASDARRQQLAALSGQTGAAQASAADLRGQQGLDISRYGAQTGALQAQQQFGLSQWQAQQQAAQAAAQLQAMQNQNLWNQQMQMMQMAGNIYSGF